MCLTFLPGVWYSMLWLWNLCRLNGEKKKLHSGHGKCSTELWEMGAGLEQEHTKRILCVCRPFRGRYEWLSSSCSQAQKLERRELPCSTSPEAGKCCPAALWRPGLHCAFGIAVSGCWARWSQNLPCTAGLPFPFTFFFKTLCNPGYSEVHTPKFFNFFAFWLGI